MVSPQIHSIDPRTHKDRVVSTGTIRPVAGTTSTTTSNLSVGAQSKFFLSPANAAAWRLFYDQPSYTISFVDPNWVLTAVASTPIVGTVDSNTDGSPKRSFTITHPAAAGGEAIDYIVVAGDLV